MHDLTHTFENLPSFFIGSCTGVISGTPNITGTFRFTINFAEAGTSGQKQIVISH